MRFGDESKTGREICSNDRYMICLYCLVVQACFYSFAVECSPVKQAALVKSKAA